MKAPDDVKCAVDHLVIPREGVERIPLCRMCSRGPRDVIPREGVESAYALAIALQQKEHKRDPERGS